MQDIAVRLPKPCKRNASCVISIPTLRHKQTPATLHSPYSMTTKTDIPSSSSSPPFRKLTYDVFLSFRGEDTRKSFTDHLYSALKQKGIFTFRDDEELERGESIAPNLLKAIEESRYAVVVFSRNYANSLWCLDEIAKIVECMEAMGQKVLPVFYDVDPYEVRHQTGDHFGKAFAKHQKRFEDHPDKVQRLKDALSQVANISGWHVKDGYESKVIGEIVEKIFTELNQRISIPEGLVGMDSHLKKVLSYLDIGGPDDVRIIGICGMGGIGKTTIAHVVFQRVKAQFEGNCFLENIREVIEKQGPVHLQQQLLLNLLKSNVNVEDIEMGKNIIKDRLCTKRVLIVLDDVDQDEQFESLCDRDWFGPGSRIIITSRDDHLLIAVEGDEIYKVDSLSDEEALQLFLMKAFKKDQLVGEEFLKLSKEFLKYADGHPLAIKVLGFSVKGRSVELWSSALDRLKRDPEKKIINVFKLSFEGLRDTEKEIFLDIACFFKGHDIDRVTRILKSCDGPNIDIEVLIEKSMVTLFGRKLWMHDLIQTMGREIVRQQYPRKPEKRSRLWVPEEIIHILDRSKATSAIESILLQGPTKDNVVHSINDSFSNMDKLRVLKIENVKFSGNIKYLSNKLQYFEWNECPTDYFPSNFQPDDLVELLMYSSRIKQLWRGEKGWCKLRLIDLTDSQYLTSTPDFTEVPELEILVLQDCTSLVDVHPSLGFLKKLFYLNMINCRSVECIPPFTSLESLKTLDLSLCSRLKKVPEIEGNMESLLELYLGGTIIEELPPSIECLTGLTTLDLTDCKNLLHLPGTIHCLISLKILNLAGCSKLEEIPKNQHCMECLEELYIGGTAITDLSFLADTKNLQHLSCRGCKGLLKGHADPTSLLPPASLTCLIGLDLSDCNMMDGTIPNDLSCLLSLRCLNLGGNSFVRLPESISQLSKLEGLDLTNCKQLQLLPKLPSSCRYVDAQGCTSLTDFPNQYKELFSFESGLTMINSLDSARRASEHVISWSMVGKDVQIRRLVRETDEHTNWKQIDQLSQPLPIPMPIIIKHYEFLNDMSNPITFIWFDDEIPEGFRNISTSNPISIPIPPNLKDDINWKGVAVCAVFVSTQETCDFPPKKRRKVGHTTIESDSETCNYLYQCTLQTDVVHMKPYAIGWEGRVPHLLMISYVASRVFPKGELNVSTVLAARFETNNPFMVVHKCGIRLVYEQDAEWFSTNMAPGVDSIWLNKYEGDDVKESGWLSQDHVDKCWKWEKFTPPMEEASTLVLRKNIESVLPRHLEALNHHSEMYKFNISGSPAWFNYYFNCIDTIMPAGSWSSYSIKIPQNLHKSKKWMGFAIYASIAGGVGHIIQEKEVEDNYRVYFNLTTGGESHKTVSRELEYIRSSEERHQLLVVYIPRAQIPEALFTETSSTAETEMDISFKMDSPHVKLQMSGVRVVYQEDIQGFVETIIWCIQKEDSFEFYDKLVVKNWIQLIRLRGGHLVGMSNPKERDPRTRREKKFELLSQKYRNWNWSTPRIVHCQFLGAEIYKWKCFMHFKQGNSAEIQLPPNWFDDANWLGIAVCAFNLLSNEDPNRSVGSTTPCADSEYNVLTCRLDSDVDWAGLHDCICEEVFRKRGSFAFSATCFIYIPRCGKCFNKFWRQCNVARATFSSSSPCLAVHSCALRLIYKDDVERLVQILTSCEVS